MSVTERKYSKWLEAGFFSGLQKISLPLFGILTTILLAHKLVQKDMGEWALFLVITGFAELLRSGLLRNSVIKFLNDKDPTKYQQVMTTSLTFNAVITMFIALIFIGLGPWIAHLLKADKLFSLLLVFLPGLFSLIFFSHYEWILIARMQFKSIFWGYFIRQVVVFVSIGLYLVMADSINILWAAVFNSAGIVAGAIVLYFHTKRHLQGWVKPQLEWVKRIFGYGKYTFGTNLSALAFRNTDQFLVSHFLLPGVVGGQNIASRITNLLDLPSQVMVDLVFSKNVQISQSGDMGRIKYFYERSVAASLAMLIPFLILGIIFSKQLMFIMGGSKYYSAIPYLQLILLTGIFLPFLKQFGTTMDSSDKPKINFLVNLVAAIVNIILCLFLIPRYGLEGAGLAVLLTYITAFLSGQWFLARYYKVSWISCFAGIIPVYKLMFGFVQKEYSRRFIKTNVDVGRGK